MYSWSLDGANLDQADLEHDHRGTKFTNITGTPILDADYSIRSGYLVGPDVDLSNLSPLGIDLTGVNLSGADLSGTNLSQANLVGVKSVGIKGTPILPEDYSIVTIETMDHRDYDP